jgi:hypothetical protein
VSIFPNSINWVKKYSEGPSGIAFKDGQISWFSLFYILLKQNMKTALRFHGNFFPVNFWLSQSKFVNISKFSKIQIFCPLLFWLGWFCFFYPSCPKLFQNNRSFQCNPNGKLSNKKWLWYVLGSYIMEIRRKLWKNKFFIIWAWKG